MEPGVNRLKINKLYQSKTCAWCGEELQFGEDGAVCEACGKPHHATHWDEHKGCGNQKCLNAPLPELAEAAASVEGEELSPDLMKCPHCAKSIAIGSAICPDCNQVTSLDGIYHGPAKIAGDATKSIFVGILSIVVPWILGKIINRFFGSEQNNYSSGGIGVGVIIGIETISIAKRAKKTIADNPIFRGKELAIVGQVLGIIGIVIPILYIAWLVISSFLLTSR